MTSQVYEISIETDNDCVMYIKLPNGKPYKTCWGIDFSIKTTREDLLDLLNRISFKPEYTQDSNKRIARSMNNHKKKAIKSLSETKESHLFEYWPPLGNQTFKIVQKDIMSNMTSVNNMLTEYRNEVEKAIEEDLDNVYS